MITMEWTMDTGVLFLIVVAGVAIGEYLAQFMLYKTSYIWAPDNGGDE